MRFWVGGCEWGRATPDRTRRGDAWGNESRGQVSEGPSVCRCARRWSAALVRGTSRAQNPGPPPRLLRACSPGCALERETADEHTTPVCRAYRYPSPLGNRHNATPAGASRQPPLPNMTANFGLRLGGGRLSVKLVHLKVFNYSRITPLLVAFYRPFTALLPPCYRHFTSKYTSFYLCFTRLYPRFTPRAHYGATPQRCATCRPVAPSRVSRAALPETLR
jgi:hypothetical protein